MEYSLLPIGKFKLLTNLPPGDVEKLLLENTNLEYTFSDRIKDTEQKKMYTGYVSNNIFKLETITSMYSRYPPSVIIKGEITHKHNMTEINIKIRNPLIQIIFSVVGWIIFVPAVVSPLIKLFSKTNPNGYELIPLVFSIFILTAILYTFYIQKEDQKKFITNILHAKTDNQVG